MRIVPTGSPSKRWLRVTMLALITVCLGVSVSGGAAAAGPPPPAAPIPETGRPGPRGAEFSEPEPPSTASAPGPAAMQPQPTALNTFIDPARLESLQQSIVGLVTIWEEPVDPFAMPAITEPQDPAAPPELPVMSICTGWFDTPTTVVTAGHCVDPKEGRLAMHMQDGPVDPETEWPLPLDPGLSEPQRTVWAFQPRELPGAVLTSPVIVRVHSFRSAEEGDTAKLEVHGLPPAKPLAIAPNAPQLGEPVTSIGFPGLNISETDGIDIPGLLSGGKAPADVLQDSRLQPASTSGTIIARQFRQGVAVNQVSADFDQGMSGGPTVNSRGEVCGINSQMAVPFFGQNFNVITDTSMLREFLGVGVEVAEAQESGVEPTSRAAALVEPIGAAEKGVFHGWPLVFSGLGGVVVGGGLVAWCLKRTRRSRLSTE
ncbi:trypsin-like peptidase domain-containing protein [Pseudonocardia kunmingensis]|uniref:Trypsin-like peptidase n=1 Tax=Pseudonocardia kunmingensis TaxID=630975 RepID=A0A543DPD3_9PSEU|nr:trypsin-like peptidase domain-containing protein [Pseudonocardia kunmingensis]TQM11168.1 trypsin-like peptidase [Pseudonocardia kunmingensis]